MTKKTVQPRMKDHYRNAVIPGMIERFGLKNPFEVPRIVKLIVNMGVNEAKEDIKALDVGHGRTRGHRRPEASGPPGQEIDFEF